MDGGGGAHRAPRRVSLARPRQHSVYFPFQDLLRSGTTQLNSSLPLFCLILSSKQQVYQSNCFIKCEEVLISGKMYLGKNKTNSNIAWHRPQSQQSLQEEELMQSSARTVISTTDPMEKLRLLCLSQGATGIMELGRIFHRLDKYESQHLNMKEFCSGIRNSGLDMTDAETEELFQKFDTDGTGSISLDEFFRHLRPEMSERRKAIVEQVFQKLDKSGEGVINVSDIRRLFSVTNEPRYKSGEETAEVIMDKFLTNFETGGVVDGKVTRDEFINFYSGLSVSIDKDSFFDLMMRQSYNL